MGGKAKALGFGGLVGLLVGLGVIYWLRPLNAGAIGLVLLLTMGFSAVLVDGIRRLLDGSKEECDEKD